MQLTDLSFIKEIDLLKNIERQTSILNGSRRENSAEHSWHLATSVFVFKSYTHHKIDLEKALSLAIFHDIVEIDAGDTFVYADLNSKADLELKTLERLVALLPQHTADEIKRLWEEAGFKNLKIDSVKRTDNGGENTVGYYMVEAEK